jgi:hypothetical protein
LCRSARGGGERLFPLHCELAIGALTFTASAWDEKLCDASGVDRSEPIVALSVSDLRQNVAGLHDIAFLDVPFGKLALLHGGGQSGHQDLGHYFRMSV